MTKQEYKQKLSELHAEFFDKKIKSVEELHEKEDQLIVEYYKSKETEYYKSKETINEVM